MKQLFSIFIIFLLANIKSEAQNYDFKGEICDNLAIVLKNGKYGFVDNNNQLVIPCIYTSINKNFYPKDFLWDSSFVLLSACKNGKWGYIDRKGNEIIPFIYDEVKSGTSYQNDILTVKKNGKYGCIDQNANVVIPFDYDDLDIIYNHKDQLVRAKKNNLYGFISPSNDIKVPFQYSTARTFGFENEYKCAAVSKNGKYGYIDLSGKEIIPLKYNFADDMHSGKYAAVVKNGRLGFIDNVGNEIIPFIYDPLYSKDGIGTTLQSHFVGPDIANVCKNGKWGAIKNDGTIIVPFIYDNYRSIGSEMVSFVKNDHIHYFDYGGNEYASEKELNEKKDEVLASQGYPRALYNMGLKFYKSKDYSTALSYFERSSAKNYKQADLYLGHHYYYGYGVEINYQTAIEYYLNAASSSL